MKKKSQHKPDEQRELASNKQTKEVCDCEKYLTLFPNDRWRCTKCWEWYYK